MPLSGTRSLWPIQAAGHFRPHTGTHNTALPCQMQDCRLPTDVIAFGCMGAGHEAQTR